MAEIREAFQECRGGISWSSAKKSVKRHKKPYSGKILLRVGRADLALDLFTAFCFHGAQIIGGL